MPSKCEDWLISASSGPQFSTELSPAFVDMLRKALRITMTTQPLDSDRRRRERRRNAAPLDPRRSPEAPASGLPPAADPAHPAALSRSCEPRRSRAPRRRYRARGGGIAGGAAQRAGEPRRLPHARPQGRRALCRQGAQPEEPGAELHAPGRAVEPAPAHGRRDRRVRDRRHRDRGRGAAARMQPDQAPDAALQRAAARRQVVSVHPSDRRPRLPAADQVPRRARQGRACISGRSPRPARSTAP